MSSVSGIKRPAEENDEASKAKKIHKKLLSEPVSIVHGEGSEPEKEKGSSLEESFEEENVGIGKEIETGCSEKSDVTDIEVANENIVDEELKDEDAGEKELEDAGDKELEDAGDKELEDAGDKELEDEAEPEPLPTEIDVGITEYISDLPGFMGVFKESYSDFLVNEIDLDGNIVRLTDLSEPEDEEMEKMDLDMLSSDEVKQIEELADGTSKEPVSIDVTNKDKEMRRKIHEAIRQNFRGLESTTKGTESSKCIIVAKETSKSRKKHHGCNYTHFVLYKENVDTMDAVNKLSSMLKFTPKVLSYAGTKDRRAKTSQAFTAYRVSPRKLLGINRRDSRIKIGNISFKDKEIRLGDLTGNHFVIILRRVEGENELIDRAMTSLASNGFINYFGMQRFGTTSIPTYEIGKAILSGKYKEAVDLILCPKYGDEDESRCRALEIWNETRDAKAALEVLYYDNGVEGCLLKGLAAHNENDYVSALRKIPRNIRLMYTHSYQSYIWNKVLSRRIKKYHLKVLPGDLISPKNTEACNDGESEKKFTKFQPKYVAPEDVDKPEHIYDVVLPLAGHSIMFPDNEIKDWYEEFMKEDGMDFSVYRNNIKDYSLSGAYRKIIVKPSKVEWEVIPYNDSYHPLVLSDYDVLIGSTLPPVEEDGKFKAIKLELSLPTSSYATMALREVMKIDTSIGTQIALSTQSH